MVASCESGFERVEIGAERLQIRLGEAFRLEAGKALAQALAWRGGIRLPGVFLVRHVLVSAIGELVDDRLRVRPDPRQRPQQAADDDRQQAERADGLEQGREALVRDLLRQDKHHPAEDNQHHLHQEKHEECDPGRELVLELRR